MSYIKVDSSKYIGLRIDKSLMSILKECYESSSVDYSDALSRDFVKGLVSSVVFVNGKVRKPSYKLKSSDSLEISFDISTALIKSKIERSDSINHIAPEKGELDIEFEDSDIVILNKAKGMVVHPAHGNTSGTLANYFRGYLESKGEYDIKLERAGIVHRLDKGVSGLMVLAKNRKAQLNLKRQFEEHEVLKIYHAKCSMISDSSALSKLKVVDEEEIDSIVENVKEKFIKGEGIDTSDFTLLEGHIGRSFKNRFQMEYFEEVVPAKGSYKKCRSAILRFNENQFIVLIRTGRMHQIRATLRYYGFVIHGDELYRNGDPVGSKKIDLESKALGIRDLSEELKVWSREII